MASFLRALSLLWCFATLSCAEYQQTTRIVDGRALVGRPVSSEAYAQYARAALLEASGQLEAALRVFLDAADSDSHSADPATRVARLYCALGNEQSAERWFEIARDREWDYASAWRERARCALRHGRTPNAIRFARSALYRAPLDFENSLMLSQALEAGSRAPDGLRLLDAYLALYPDDRRARQAAWDLAQRVKPASTLLNDVSSVQRAALPAQDPPWSATPDPLNISGILSLVQNGQRKRAQKDAALLSAAAPNNSDAHALLLLLSALISDSVQQQLAATRLRNSPTPVHPDVVLLFEQTLRLIEPGLSDAEPTPKRANISKQSTSPVEPTTLRP